MAAQIVVMNAGFTSLMARATQSQPMEAFATYMRYGLRFQNQCRATAETLATMKMPPVFAKQANISNGPQQVNNNVGERPTVTVGRVRTKVIFRRANFWRRHSMANGWTEERKTRQRQAIHRWRPWTCSTGPVSAEGKARVSQNAYRGGERSKRRAFVRELNQLLRQQGRYLRFGE